MLTYSSCLLLDKIIKMNYDPSSLMYSNISYLVDLTYFATNTGQCAYVTMCDATLPSNNLLDPDLPLVPITIKSILFSSA